MYCTFPGTRGTTAATAASGTEAEEKGQKEKIGATLSPSGKRGRKEEEEEESPPDSSSNNTRLGDIYNNKHHIQFTRLITYSRSSVRYYKIDNI